MDRGVGPQRRFDGELCSSASQRRRCDPQRRGDCRETRKTPNPNCRNPLVATIFKHPSRRSSTDRGVIFGYCRVTGLPRFGRSLATLESSLFSRPHLGDTKVNSAGDAQILHYSLPGYVGASRAQLFRESRLHQRNPRSDPFHLVSGSKHSTVCTLNELAATFPTLASSTGSTFLWHLRISLPLVRSLHYKRIPFQQAGIIRTLTLSGGTVQQHDTM